MMGECVGRRVELPAWSERWMRGDRYGVVVDVRRKPSGLHLADVKLDKSGFTRSFVLANLTLI